MALAAAKAFNTSLLLGISVVLYALLPAALVAADSPRPAISPSELLLDCYNGGARAASAPPPPSPPPADFNTFLDGKPVNLRLERVWWSAKGSPLPLTIFTMATVDRLPLLEAQCHSYPGPLSAAIYLPLLLLPATGGNRSSSSSGGGVGGDGGGGGHRARQPADGTAIAGGGAAAGAESESDRENGAEAAQRRRNARLLEKTLATLQAAFSRLESSPAACSLVLALYSESLTDPALAALMPTNSLRNAALLPAATPLVAMVDADLSASRGLGQLAANRSRVSELLAGSTRRRILWVLPAWETRRGLDSHTANLVVDSALAGGKASLERLWRRSIPWTAAATSGSGGTNGGGGGGGNPRRQRRRLLAGEDSGLSGQRRRQLAAAEEAAAAAEEAAAEAGGQVAAEAGGQVAAEGPLHPFDTYDFAGGHGPTDYARFLAADAPYPVSFQDGYEPWFLTARNVSLPYDERFRGWYGDKFSQVLHSVAARFAFWVLPDVWIIHRPHPPVAARTLYRHESSGPSPDIDHLSELLVRRLVPRTKFRHYVIRVRNLEYRQRRTLARHRSAFRPQVGPAVARCRSELPWWREGDGGGGDGGGGGESSQG